MNLDQYNNVNQMYKVRLLCLVNFAYYIIVLLYKCINVIII